MKIYIEREVSNDPKYCKGCGFKEENYCTLFWRHLSRNTSGTRWKIEKCEECLSAPKRVTK